jgi:ribosome-associated protein
MPMTTSPETWDPTLASAVRALSARKVEQLVVLDLRDKSSFTDYFVICHGTSDRQVKAVAEDVLARVKEETGRRAVSEGLSQGEWVLLDYGDFLVHIFGEAARDFYRLDSLWGDAPHLDPKTAG